MAITKTYAVGNAGIVRRLDDHTGPWLDVSTGDGKSNLLDVMTDPTDTDKVFIVGSVSNLNGILYSTNAGLSWIRPGGDWTTTGARNFYEVWVVDTNIIWAVGEFGTVVRSTDGGLNFFRTGPINPDPIRYTTAIHALDDKIAVVAGGPSNLSGSTQAYAWKTIDGGVSWISLNGGSSLVNALGTGAVGTPEGIWISGDQQQVIVSTEYTQNISTDFGTTFADSLAEMTLSGKHLTWYPSYAPVPSHFRHVGGDLIQINESTNIGASWISTRFGPKISILGAHFYSINNGYYTINGTTYATTDGGVTGVISDSDTATGAARMHAVWSSTFTPLYRLIDCEARRADIYSDSVLLSPLVGSIVNIDAVGVSAATCWTVETWDDPSVIITFLTAVLSFYDNCEDCVPPPPDVICWDLISCNDNCAPIIGVSGIDFSPYLGGLLTVNGDNSCVFEAQMLRQAFFPGLKTYVNSNPTSAFQLGLNDKTLEVASLIYNSVEYIIGVPPTYLLTPGNYNVVECTGLTCAPVAVNTTENCVQNLVTFFSNVLASIGLDDELQVYCNDPANCFIIDDTQEQLTALETIRVQYRDGNTLAIVFNVNDNSPTSLLYEVAAGNLTQVVDLNSTVAFETCNGNTFCVPASPSPVISSVDAWLFPCPTATPSTELGEACDIVPRLGEPGFTFKNCDAREVIKIKTNYAEAIYAFYKRMRFGIETCCEFDLDRIQVKNQLLELGKLLDPDLCGEQPLLLDCCPAPCNAVANLIIPLSVGCPAPTDVITVINLFGLIPCTPPDNALAVLSIN